MYLNTTTTESSKGMPYFSIKMLVPFTLHEQVIGLLSGNTRKLEGLDVKIGWQSSFRQSFVYFRYTQKCTKCST